MPNVVSGKSIIIKAIVLQLEKESTPLDAKALWPVKRIDTIFSVTCALIFLGATPTLNMENA